MKITRRKIKSILKNEIKKAQINEVAPVVAYSVAAALLGGATWWAMTPSEEQIRIEREVQEQGLIDAFTLYSALKGTGTDNKVVSQILNNTKDLLKLYCDYAKVLVIVDDLDSGGLITWLIDDDRDEDAKMLLIDFSKENF